MRDSRLVGATAESIFLSLLNERGIFATSFDTAAFDGIIFDTARFYVQIKCRGSQGGWFNPQGHDPQTFDKIRDVAGHLGISEASLYFVVGFFKNGDIRTVIYYCIPFASLHRFRAKSQYRFSVERCE